MKLDSDDFELFGLPRRFALGREEVDARWKALQAEVHPDRFVADGAAAQRLAMQRAVRVNEARQRLRDPLRRAAYLCELLGAPIRAEDNTAMPGDFLMQQMAWREALDDAAGLPAVEQLADEVARFRAEALQPHKADPLHRLVFSICRRRQPCRRIFANGVGHFFQTRHHDQIVKAAGHRHRADPQRCRTAGARCLHFGRLDSMQPTKLCHQSPQMLLVEQTAAEHVADKKSIYLLYLGICQRARNRLIGQLAG